MEKDSRDSHFTGGPTLSTTDRISFCTSHETFFPSNLQFYYLEAYLLKVISTIAVSLEVSSRVTVPGHKDAAISL